MTPEAKQRSYELTAHLVAALAGQCSGAPNKVIDLLTGYLWDSDEAERLKQAAALNGYRAEGYHPHQKAQCRIAWNLTLSTDAW